MTGKSPEPKYYWNCATSRNVADRAARACTQAEARHFWRFENPAALVWRAATNRSREVGRSAQTLTRKVRKGH